MGAAIGTDIVIFSLFFSFSFQHLLVNIDNIYMLYGFMAENNNFGIDLPPPPPSLFFSIYFYLMMFPTKISRTTSHARLTTVQEAQEELRAQIAQASAAGNAKDVEINKLEQTTAVLETRVEEQQQKVAKMQAELQQHRAGGGSGGASEAQVASLQADLVQARALNKALEAKIEEAVKGPSPAPAPSPSPLELQNENVMLASKLEDCKCENDALLESDMLAATMAERDALTSHLVVENARLAASVSASARAASVSRVLRSRQVEVAAAAAAVNRARVRVFAPPIATASSSALGSYYKLRAEREGRLRSLERARRSGMRY